MDLNNPQNCLTFNLLKAARTMTRQLDAAFAPLSLSAQQFTALAQIKGHGSLSTSRLADLTGTERTTVTRNLARLETQGLIESDSKVTDRRVSAWKLTQAGRDTFAQAFDVWSTAQSDLVTKVKGQPPEDFLATLKQL